MADSSSLSTADSPLTTDPQITLSSDRSPLQTDRLTSSSSLLTTSAPAVAALQTSPKPATAVFWRNSATGENRLGVTGDNSTSTVALPALPDPAWKIVSTNDYNRDDQTDFLWRNYNTGAIKWWVMNGTASPLEVNLPTVTDFNWQIVSTADYDRDGNIDLLWRNIKTGEDAWWVMKGAELKNVAVIPSVADLNWQIVGTNDYNGDKEVDLLWRNVKTGENAWWQMKGQTATSIMLTPVADQNWAIVGTGDYNRDGQVDLLWRSTAGQTVWWLMNGSQISGTSWLPNETDLNWQVIGINDRYTPTIAALKAQPTAPAPNLSTSSSLTPNFSTTLTPNFDIQASGFTQTRSFGASSFDLYRFTVAQSGTFTASLTQLIGDADVRLIQDDGNQQIDEGEIKAWQWERGTKAENISSFLSAGTYLVQVFGYNGQAASYNLSTGFTAAASDSQKFSINLQYDTSLGGLSTIAQEAARAAADFWEKIIPSRSAITNSSNLNITVSGRSLDFNTYAVAGPIFNSDRQTVTIASGAAYINTQRLDFFTSSQNAGYLKLVLIHEFAHVLGIGTLWEPVKFDTGNGTSLTVGKNLIDRSTSTYNILNGAGGQTYASWAYGDLLGLYTPKAVPIEPGVFAHWSETTFGSEAMTPFAEAPGVKTPVSTLTLAALRDLGWTVNYGAAQPYPLPVGSAALTVPGSSATSKTTTTAKAALTAKCGCSSCLAGVSLPLLGDTKLANLV